mmetsp:Transcript_31763/g.73732  ORF Transcript_31763/g.73732 Transcript_31763/m.73732 type:complete len:214 (-) Transcript_31763:42-683(-)
MGCTIGCSIGGSSAVGSERGTGSSNAKFAVTVVTLGGSAKVVGGLDGSITLGVLRERCARTFDAPPGTAVELVVGTQTLAAHDSQHSLSKLGIGGGTCLTLIVQTWVRDVREGTRIRVRGAGSACVNGDYVCIKLENQHPWDSRPQFQFKKHGGTMEINCYRNTWIIENGRNHPIYFHATATERFTLPCAEWECYSECMELVGMPPGPTIELI